MAMTWYASRYDEVTHYKTLLSYIKGKIAGERKSTRAYNKMGSLHKYIDSTKETLLHHSAVSDDTSTTRRLIDYGLDINAQNIDGNTPLMLAARKMKEESVCVLLKAGAEIDIDDYSGKNVLEKLTNDMILNSSIPGSLLMKLVDKCETVGEAALNLLLVKCPLNVAVLMKSSKIIKYFMKHRSNTSGIDQNRLSALHVAVHYENSEIVKFLLDKGYNVNVRDSNDFTPLHYMQQTRYCEKERLKIVKYFLSKSPQLTTDIESADYALQFTSVVQHGHKEIIILLLKANLDLNVKLLGDDGYNLLHVLSSNMNPGVFEVVPKNYPVNVHERTFRNYTALHLAALYGRIDAIRFLLDRGADVNAHDDMSWTPLFHVVAYDGSTFETARSERIECFELLLQYNADIQIVTDRGSKTIFDVLFDRQTFYMIPPILAHLALLKATGTSIKHEISTRISADDRLAKPFNLFKQQLEQLKETVIIEPVTMYGLLTESEQKLLIYLRNHQFVLNLEQTEYDKNQDYYYEKLQERIGRALQKVKLKQRAAAVLSEIMKISYDSHPVVIDKIFSFLNERDLQELSQI